jgi:hypothetical protein|tara:strand:- start:13063 stop:14469 length:1407 start_codon:yes stop_codon:yes gene_type:complete
MKKLSEGKAKQTLGVAGDNTHNGQIRADEFLRELRGSKAIKKYREMRDNDATIGAVMYSVEQILRDVELTVKPVDDTPAAKVEADFVTSVLDDMDHTLDDHVSEALSYLSYGFGWFEVIYKRRVGPTERSDKKHSKYTDGRLGVKKIAARAPWTINKFDVDQKTGEVLGIEQSVGLMNGRNYIPVNKSIYYRTTTLNGDPSGRSILRNAYTSYEYLNNLQSIEAIAVERELAGIPVARIPAEYLSNDASAAQTGFVRELQQILRDVKFNEQGYIVLPSDTYPDKDGAPSTTRLVDIELMASNGKRNIEIGPMITRYQHDIARSVLSEFLLLGTSGGSYALSKSKTDLFLRALESYIQAIVDVLNKQLVERLWELNGLNYDLMPTIESGDVAPHDLKEVSSFLRNLNGADIDVSAHPEVVNDLMSIAELDFDVSAYKKPEPETVVVAPTEPTETEKLEHELLKSLIKGE